MANVLNALFLLFLQGVVVQSVDKHHVMRRASATPSPQLHSESEIGVTANGALNSRHNQFAVRSLDEEDLTSLVGDNEQEKTDIRKFWYDLQTVRTPLLTDSFQVERFIANGSSARVFQARDKHSNVQVVLKMLPMGSEDSAIVNEWYVANRLRQHGVSGVALVEEQVYVVRGGEVPKAMQDHLGNEASSQDYVCFVQQLLPWGSLDQEPLSPQVMLKCLTDVAFTLAEVHKSGVQHRDVQPTNIMLEKRNDIVSAKLCDFGDASAASDPEALKQDIDMFGMTLGMTLFRAALGDNKIDRLHLRQRRPTPELLRSLTKAVNKNSALHGFLHIYKEISGGTRNLLQKYLAGNLSGGTNNLSAGHLTGNLLQEISGGGLQMADIAQMMAEANKQYS